MTKRKFEQMELFPKNTIKAQCHNCKGRGVVMMPVPSIYPLRTNKKELPCSYCNGTGTVPLVEVPDRQLDGTEEPTALAFSYPDTTQSRVRTKRPKKNEEKTFTKAEVRELVWKAVGYSVGVCDAIPKLTKVGLSDAVWVNEDKDRSEKIRNKTLQYLETLFSKVGI